MHPTVVRYIPRPNHEREAEALIQKIWPTLHQQGLTTDQMPIVIKITCQPPHYLEFYEWRSSTGPKEAEQNERVNRILSALREVAEMEPWIGTYLECEPTT